MAKISVIVPVYNVSDYIEQCLQGLMQQTLQDIEIIVIDDCGTDDSIKKAAKLAKTDKRIKIIHNKVNMGLAESRNIGLKCVKSEYVGFIDSDDWVAVNFYEKLYDDIVKYKADIAVGDVLYYRKEQHTLTREWVSTWNFKSNKKVVSLPKDKQNNIYACACWNKLYRTELFTKYNLKYPKGLKIEDVPITTATTILAKKIVMVKDAVLFYRQRSDSIMGQGLRNRTPFDIFKIYEYTDTMIDLIEQKTQKSCKEYRKILDNFKIFNVYSWYSNTYCEYQPEFLELMKRLFLRIDIEHNPYITAESKETYRLVLSEDKIQEIKTIKLFNAILLIRVLKYIHLKKIYLFKNILLDRIKITDKNSKHYLFGFLPILTVKRK